MMNSYLSLDLETTGVNPKQERIIEFGAVRIEDGVCTGVFESFVNPGRRLEEKVIRLTGITDEDLADAPEITEVLPRFLEFAKDLPLLGHSVWFDFSFVKKAAVNQGLSFERAGVDTYKIAKKYLADLPKRNLGFLCEHYHISLHAHRAVEDARAAVALYEAMWEQFGGEEDVSLFEPVLLQYQVKQDRPATKSQKERLYKLVSMHKIDTIYDIDKLTRSEASRYTDRILSKYGRL